MSLYCSKVEQADLKIEHLSGHVIKFWNNQFLVIGPLGVKPKFEISFLNHLFTNTMGTTIDDMRSPKKKKKQEQSFIVDYLHLSLFWDKFHGNLHDLVHFFACSRWARITQKWRPPCGSLLCTQYQKKNKKIRRPAWQESSWFLIYMVSCYWERRKKRKRKVQRTIILWYDPMSRQCFNYKGWMY